LDDHKGAAYFIQYVCEISDQQRFFRIDDYVRSDFSHRTRQANGFAQAALHAVALHRTAQSAAHGESYPQTMWRGASRPCLYTYFRAR